MEESRFRSHIKILERLETLASWLAEMDEPVSREGRLIRRYLRSILKTKYRSIMRQGTKNISRESYNKLLRLRKYDYYETKASGEVKNMLKTSISHGSGLWLQHIFGEYKDIHGCCGYREFLMRIDEFGVDKTGFRYLRYLNDLRRYMVDFIRIKYPALFRGLKISRNDVLIEMDAREFIETGGISGEGLDVTAVSTVYCVPCKMEISRNVFRFHMNGKRHLKKKADGETLVYFRGSIVDVEGEVVKMLNMLKKERTYSIRSSNKRRSDKSNDMPRWLFKRKELDILFKCDICGYSGKGREPFEAHFSNAEHVASLRKYGIENCEGLRGVTKVSTLMRIRKKEEFEEEFEDDEGNVFDKKTYEDLKRNNLI